ncbi:endonuclease III [Patescibacteria group bacterium]|nr:endonuclease III [Patescibacteria group bacterium]
MVGDGKQIVEALARLRDRYPEPGALAVGSPFVVLLAVMFSARTKDEQVLKLLPGFFREFPTPQILANADLSVIEARLSTIGMFRQKAKNAKALALMLVHDFGGGVPGTLAELIRLPGVGRKTASVVLTTVFAQPAVAVDVHVARIVTRLGWSKAITPEAIEQDLLAIVPEELQATVNETMVPFGREICTARSPSCFACPVVDLCAYSQKNLLSTTKAQQSLARAHEVRKALVHLVDETAEQLRNI